MNAQTPTERGSFVQYPCQLIYHCPDLTRDDKWVLLAIMGVCWTEDFFKLSYREISTLSGVPLSLLSSVQGKDDKPGREGIMDRLQRFNYIRCKMGKSINRATGKPKGNAQTYISVGYTKIWAGNTTKVNPCTVDAFQPVLNANEPVSYANRLQDGEGQPVSYANSPVLHENRSVSYANEPVRNARSNSPLYITLDYLDTLDEEREVVANATNLIPSPSFFADVIEDWKTSPRRTDVLPPVDFSSAVAELKSLGVQVKYCSENDSHPHLSTPTVEKPSTKNTPPFGEVGGEHARPFAQSEHTHEKPTYRQVGKNGITSLTFEDIVSAQQAVQQRQDSETPQRPATQARDGLPQQNGMQIPPPSKTGSHGESDDAPDGGGGTSVQRQHDIQADSVSYSPQSSKKSESAKRDAVKPSTTEQPTPETPSEREAKHNAPDGDVAPDRDGENATANGGGAQDEKPGAGKGKGRQRKSSDGEPAIAAEEKKLRTSVLTWVNEHRGYKLYGRAPEREIHAEYTSVHKLAHMLYIGLHENNLDDGADWEDMQATWESCKKDPYWSKPENIDRIGAYAVLQKIARVIKKRRDAAKTAVAKTAVHVGASLGSVQVQHEESDLERHSREIREKYGKKGA